jgi:hypothetical protein
LYLKRDLSLFRTIIMVNFGGYINYWYIEK